MDFESEPIYFFMGWFACKTTLIWPVCVQFGALNNLSKYPVKLCQAFADAIVPIWKEAFASITDPIYHSVIVNQNFHLERILFRPDMTLRDWPGVKTSSIYQSTIQPHQFPYYVVRLFIAVIKLSIGCILVWFSAKYPELHGKACSAVRWIRSEWDNCMSPGRRMGHSSAALSAGVMGGSIGRASDSRSKGPRFESRQEHKKKIVSFSESRILCWLAVGVPNPRVVTHAQEWSRTHVLGPVVHVRVRWNTETRNAWPRCNLLQGG